MHGDHRSAIAGDGGGQAGFSARQRGQLEAILRVLEQDEHAPTAIRSRDEAATLHLADSLVALELDPVRSATRLADIGAGAGFPGAALAVAMPAAEVALVESHQRKCEFLERLCAEAELENARTVCSRAEQWLEGLGRHDLVVARAVGPQPVVLEYAAPLLRVGGTLVDWRGRRSEAEEQAALRAADELGLRRVEIRRVSPFDAAKDRHLHVFAKVDETPERFPRRAGVARKRPLGS
jgi:16S rRNA (guanine527-N7)-methyltransferase